MMTLPVGISYADWFSQLRLDRPELSSISNRPDESNWIGDVELLLRDPICSTLNVPRPEHFSDWRGWAERFVQSYGGAV